MRKNYPVFLFTLLFSQQLFAQVPTISSFSPASGPVGTLVTITGTNFSSSTANNIVFFGAVRAVVNTVSSNSLAVIVPAGATFQPITVMVNGLTAYSFKPFLVTFALGESTFISNSFEPVINYNSGSGTSCIAAGDFDQDGRADIISASIISNSLTVFRNISNTSVLLGAQTYIASGNKPSCLVTGDLDGDGQQDIVMVNGGNNTVSLFRNISNNTGKILFTAKIDLSTGTFPYAAAIRDFNGDGRPDIAVVNSSGNTVSIFKNNSLIDTFSFSNKIDFVTGSSPFWIDAGDLDGDGKPDIATANGVASNSVSVLRNISTTATISFAAKADFDGGNLAYGISIADMDNDNKQDLIVADGAVSAGSVLLNNSAGAGNISFAPKQTLLTGYFAYSAVPGDMNGDGKVDIIVGNENQSSVSVFKNASTSGVLSFDTQISYQVHYGPWVVVPVDLNNDGKLDIVTANETFGYISVLQKKDVPHPAITSFNPTVAGPGDTVTITGKNFTNVNSVSFGSVKAASFQINSNTVILAVVGSGESGKISIANSASADSIIGFKYIPPPNIDSINFPNAMPGSIVTIFGSGFNQISSVMFGDKSARSFNVESPEVIKAVVDSFSGGAIKVLGHYGIARLAGFYNGPIINSFSPTSGYVGSEVVIRGSSFNPNVVNNYVYFGTMRAIVKSASDTSLTVIVPAGSTFQPLSVVCNKLVVFADEAFNQVFENKDSVLNSNSFAFAKDLPTTTNPGKILSGDFDNDGKPDLVIIDGIVKVYKNTSINENISFDKTDLAVEGRVIDVSDMNNDGKLDVIAFYQQELFFFKNTTANGMISFASPEIFSITNGSDYRPGITDFDQDGRPDIVVVSAIANAWLLVYRNTSANGDISFSIADTLLNAYGPVSVGTGDLDGDGKPDIAVTSQGSVIYVYRNLSESGKIAFADLQTINTNRVWGFGQLLICDVDKDSKLDLITPNDTSILIFKNISNVNNISFAESKGFSVGANFYDLTIQDFNGDGNIDISGVSHFTNKLYILKNNSYKDSIVFSLPNEYLTGMRPWGITSIDFDIDGKSDIAVSNFGSSSISIYRNKVGENNIINFCPPFAETTLLSSIAGANYQWQLNTGNGFNNLTNNGNYSGVTTSSFQLINIPSSASGYQYRCVADGNNSDVYELKFVDSWTGALNTDWNNAANWTCNAVPDRNTDVTINSGNLMINSNVTIRSLKVNPGATVTVNTGYTLTVLH